MPFISEIHTAVLVDCHFTVILSYNNSVLQQQQQWTL